MMAVVNLFSSAFTAASIFVGMEVGYVFDFLASCPEICMHIFLMAVCEPHAHHRCPGPHALPVPSG